MSTKLFLVVAAVCVATAFAGTATYDVDVINAYPSADGATFTLAGTDLISDVMYKGKASKSVTLDDSAGTTAVIKIGSNPAITVNLIQAQVAGLVVNGDAYASLHTYKKHVTGTTFTPAYGIAPLPKAGFVATAMYTQFANAATSTMATYPTVTVAYMYTISTEVAGVTVSTTTVNAFKSDTQGAYMTLPMIIVDPSTINAGSKIDSVKIKVVKGDATGTINTQASFDSATGLFQSGSIDFKAGLSSCIVSGDCGANAIDACSTGDYPLAITCDKINFSGVAALKPTMVFALLAAAIAMFFAW